MPFLIAQVSVIVSPPNTSPAIFCFALYEGHYSSWSSWLSFSVLFLLLWISCFNMRWFLLHILYKTSFFSLALLGGVLFVMESHSRKVPLVMSASRKFLLQPVLMGFFFFTILGVGVLVCVYVLLVLFFNKECCGVNYSSSKQYPLIYSLPFKMCLYTIFTLQL